MTTSLRIVLVVSALLVLYFIIRRLKRTQIEVMDSIFWLFFSFSFVQMAVFSYYLKEEGLTSALKRGLSSL